MGGSLWSDDFYRDREEVRKKTGTSAFVYNAKVAAAPRHEQKTHEKMDPKGVAMRESRDSREHPESLAISVMFDVTGSMGSVPVTFQKQLPKLMGQLNARDIKDPQILIGGVGDSRSDRGSLQVGQFESGIEMDDDLGKMWLEGGGGGTMEESYQNAIYFHARHTALDCFEKRGKKGFLFLIGDEKPYMTVFKDQIKAICDDGLQADIPIKDIITEAQQKYHVFFIIPTHTSHGGNPEIHSIWSSLLGADRVLLLGDESQICETITAAVGSVEFPSTEVERSKPTVKVSRTARL